MVTRSNSLFSVSSKSEWDRAMLLSKNSRMMAIRQSVIRKWCACKIEWGEDINGIGVPKVTKKWDGVKKRGSNFDPLFLLFSWRFLQNFVDSLCSIFQVKFAHAVGCSADCGSNLALKRFQFPSSHWTNVRLGGIDLWSWKSSKLGRKRSYWSCQ